MNKLNITREELARYAHVKDVTLAEVAKAEGIHPQTLSIRKKSKNFDIDHYIDIIDKLAEEKGTNYPVCRMKSFYYGNHDYIGRVTAMTTDKVRCCKNCVRFTGQKEDGICENFRYNGIDLSETCKNCLFWNERNGGECSRGKSKDMNGTCGDFEESMYAEYMGIGNK